MKIVILGAGVVGVTTAWYLSQAGHEVIVVDRQPGVALETSFANAGQISPGYAAPWSAPGIPFKAVRWLMQEHAPLSVRLDGSCNQLRWMGQMLMNCNNIAYQRNKMRMVRIAEYSRDCMIALRELTAIEYEGRQQGTLQLFRTQKQVDAMAKDVAVLQQCGVPFQVLDREGCVQAEPSLAQVKQKIMGGLRLPGDETGDCHLFTQALAKRCVDHGVTFMFNSIITQIEVKGDQVNRICLEQGTLVADRYIVALGSYSPLLVKAIGIDMPIYPVKGYSITIPIIDAAAAPISTVLDETYKIAITRFDQRIRVGGMAELAGYDLSLNHKRRNTLKMVVKDLFPNGGDIDKAEFWTGLRPMTPDGTPIIGISRLPNLFFNTGHGTLGWTMCAGSGKVLADLISGTTPEIDVSDLSLARYR